MGTREVLPQRVGVGRGPGFIAFSQVFIGEGHGEVPSCRKQTITLMSLQCSAACKVFQPITSSSPLTEAQG